METNINIKGYSINNLMSYNNPSFVEKMIHVFIKTANEFSNNITKALITKNLIQINQLAHSIKPSIDILSVRSVITCIREIECAVCIDDELIEKISYIKLQLHAVINTMKKDYPLEN